MWTGVTRDTRPISDMGCALRHDFDAWFEPLSSPERVASPNYRPDARCAPAGNILWAETAEDGGLLAYGPRNLLCYRHVVSLVDKGSPRRKAGRSADRATIQVRVGREPKDSECNRHDDLANAPPARRRGDRIACFLLQRVLSALTRSGRAASS